VIGHQNFCWWNRNLPDGKRYYFVTIAYGQNFDCCYFHFLLNSNICSYRKANTRLRKMGRPELEDVTSTRLTLRPEIEKEIECIITRCGFRRVLTKSTMDEKVAKDDDAITSWNRSLRLYERFEQ
jgi:hypothetical protein